MLYLSSNVYCNSYFNCHLLEIYSWVLCFGVFILTTSQLLQITWVAYPGFGFSLSMQMFYWFHFRYYNACLFICHISCLLLATSLLSIKNLFYSFIASLLTSNFISGLVLLSSWTGYWFLYSLFFSSPMMNYV